MLTQSGNLKGVVMKKYIILSLICLSVNFVSSDINKFKSQVIEYVNERANEEAIGGLPVKAKQQEIKRMLNEINKVHKQVREYSNISKSNLNKIKADEIYFSLALIEDLYHKVAQDFGISTYPMYNPLVDRD